MCMMCGNPAHLYTLATRPAHRLVGRYWEGSYEEAAAGALHPLIGEMKELSARHERFWLGIAPEGTRKPVERWKSGFWRIASEAGVPVLCASFHYPERRIHIGPVFELSGDMDADIARMREWFRPWQGKHRGV